MNTIVLEVVRVLGATNDVPNRPGIARAFITILLAVVVSSCTGTNQTSEGNLLRVVQVPSSRDRDTLTVTIAGELGRPVKLGSVTFVDAEAADENQAALVCEWTTRPDSKYGPLIVLETKVAGTTKAVSANSRFRYKGQGYSLVASFRKDDSGTWKVEVAQISPG